MSLQALADKVVAQAAPGEQVEAYVSRGGNTEVRVYQGEVEHFVSAQSEGIGVRVIRDGRTGFAYAGTLDPSAVDEVLAEARDNVTFGTVDEWAGLAEPDGVERTPQVLWNDVLAGFPTDRKIELAKELERLTLAQDTRLRIDDSNYADAWGEVAVATTTGIRESGRENGCYVSISTLADDGDETQTGFGFSVGREPDDFDLDRAAREAAERATRLLGATKPPSRRLTVVLDPFVTAQFLGIIGSTLNGESVVKGRSLFRERLGEIVAAPGVTLVDDPTDAHAYTATDVDGEGLAARRNVLDRGRHAAAVRARQLLGTAGRHRVHRQRHPGRVLRHARRRVPGPAAGARDPQPGRADRRRRRRAARPERHRPPLRRQRRQRGLLDRRVRDAHHERRARRTGAGDDDRLDAAAHAARHRRGRQRRRLAADARRRRQPGHPRCDDERRLS